MGDQSSVALVTMLTLNCTPAVLIGPLDTCCLGREAAWTRCLRTSQKRHSAGQARPKHLLCSVEGPWALGQELTLLEPHHVGKMIGGLGP